MHFHLCQKCILNLNIVSRCFVVELTNAKPVVKFPLFTNYIILCFPLFIRLKDQGGFQLEFLSISRVINHMTCYNLSALID